MTVPAMSAVFAFGVVGFFVVLTVIAPELTDPITGGIYTKASGVAHYGGDSNKAKITVATMNGTTKECKRECTKVGCTHFETVKEQNMCTLYRGRVWLGKSPSNNVYCKGWFCENGM